jgi:endonuclease YncB( thermonuclease family)
MTDDEMPMSRPPLGLYLPCRLTRVKDGDTIEVRIPGTRWPWAIRLIGVDAPKATTPEGKEAKEFVEKTLADADDLAVWIPAPKKIGNLLENLSFERIIGDIWVGTQTRLSRLLLWRGYAKPRRKRT